MENLKFFEFNRRMPLLTLPVRTTFIQLEGAGVLYSPGSKMSVDDFKNLGEATDIVAPNTFHCEGVINAKKAFPNATLWGPENIRKLKPKFPWDKEISQDTWPFGKELPFVHIQGTPQLNEVVLVHKSSKTLLVADLCFNLVDAKGLGAWLILKKMFDTYRKFAISKFYLSYVKDQKAFEKSVSKVFEQSFDRVIPAHGALVNQNGKEQLRQAFKERSITV